MTLTDLIHEYEQQQRSRALGGLRALSGFDFQLRCHLAEFVEQLVSSNGVLVGGQEFAQGLEALSDFTTTTRDKLVYVQAKRTLKTTAMAQAAVEFATIAEFLQNSSTAGAAAIRPRFRVVGNRSELAADWSWDAVTLPAKEVSKRPELQQAWQSLVDGHRLDPPQVERDPWWRVIAATFQRLDKPFEFAREALDLCLRRHESTAERVRDDVAKLFRKHLSQAPLKNFQAVTESDFAPDPDERLQPLRVGYRPSLALVRNRQFLTRDVHVQHAIISLDALLLHQDYGNVTGLPVLWISGPSGCGKSVLLLQVMESLVKSGVSAVSLEDDARRVNPLLHAVCAERDADSTDLPSFIFIDDLYSPQNQQRIDLPELDNIVGTRPFDRWPVIVTCGPPEFYDRLERESSRSTLHLERWSLPLVEIQPSAAGDPAEADLFTAWFQQRTGDQPQRGSAFSERQGLMISMAFELRFEDPNAIKDFASRFRERLKADELDQTLVLPLALNRLYLPAPAEWLSERDRERFDAINQEKDFSILDLGGDGEFLRLTHPHISDEIYRAIRDPATPRAFANDLAEAMRRAMASNLTTLRLLLRALSSADPRITERLEDVDLDRLAESVTADWKKSDVESRLGGSELSDVSTSWACWHARKPELQLEQRLGHSLFAAARSALGFAGSAWSFLWQRLRAAFPGDTSLLADAVEWLHESASERSRGWSFIWEEVWDQRAVPGLPFDERTLVLCARGWLERQWDQEDWHFVWTKLVDRPSEAVNSKTSEVSTDVGSLAEIIELGWRWLNHKPSSARSGVIPHHNLAAWAYIWQDLLRQERFESDPARSELLKLGFDWLLRPEDRNEWSYVWRLLITSPNLPTAIEYGDLLGLGVNWLVGREDRSDWPNVWGQLLKSAALTETMRVSLLTRGADWLAGHECSSGWAFVWTHLVDSPTLPTNITRKDLLARGADWLQKREDGNGWSLVWGRLQTARSKQRPITLEVLFDRGIKWLEDHIDRNAWPYAWLRCVKSVSDLSPTGRLTLLQTARSWLLEPNNLHRREWSKLLERWIDIGGCGDDVLGIASHWIEQNLDKPQVPILAAKVVRTAQNSAAVDRIAQWLSDWCQANSGSSGAKLAVGYFVAEHGKGWSPTGDTPGGKAFLAWWAPQAITIHRPDDAIAAFLQQMKAAGQSVSGCITQRLPRGFFVTLRQPAITAFLPKSQVDLQTPTDWDAFIGLECEFRIQRVLLQESGCTVTVSRRKALKDERLARKEVRLQELRQGERVVGTVERLMEYGAFIDLDGVTGLVHVSDLSWQRTALPADLCVVGQQLEFVVLNIDMANRRVSLGLKQLAPNPWESFGRELVEGSDVDGTVTRIQVYGAFVEVAPGVIGLLHQSNISWDRKAKLPQDSLQLGQRVRCRILRVDVATEQLELGLKQLTPNPWETIGPTMIVGSDIDGTVTNLVNYGAFIEIASGVDGLLHVSNLAWVKRISHPNEFLEMGQRLRCRILSLDVENHKMELGLKQLTANPWDERIPRQYLVGAWIEGRVAKVTNFGLFVELEPDLQGLLHPTEIPDAPADPTELSQHFEIGQMLRVRILRVDVDEQKIALSLKPSET